MVDGILLVVDSVRAKLLLGDIEALRYLGLYPVLQFDGF